MDHFVYEGGELTAEGVRLGELAECVGTPAFVYSAQTVRDHAGRLVEAFDAIRPRVCYAVKACHNHHVLRLLADAGLGMDVVSIGELERAWLAGVSPERMVFAGVGKTRAEIAGALDGARSPLANRPDVYGARDPRGRASVGTINAESESEIGLIDEVAREVGRTSTASLRVNPDVDARTHRHTTTGRRENKFGVDIAVAEAVFDRWGGGNGPGVRLDGLHMHLGSPIYSPEPYAEAIGRMGELIDRLRSRGHAVRRLNIGGGFGADYETAQTPTMRAYADRLTPLLRPMVASGVEIYIEPGRLIMGNAGVLLVRVEHVKRGAERTFVVCDAGMNALIRPALYEAFHFVWPVRPVGGAAPPRRARDLPEAGGVRCDVVGPICESADYLARDWRMPPVERGDVLAVFTAGAYGMSMASTYNDHPLPAEVLVDNGLARMVRSHQSVADLIGPGREAVPVDLGRPTGRRGAAQ